eukprot:jgi/Botrbrau1/8413/Bobra.0237s0033.1
MSSNVSGFAFCGRRPQTPGHPAYRQGSQSGQALAKPERSLVEHYLCWSFLKFHTAAVESGYQRFLAKQAGTCVLLFIPVVVLSGGQMVYHAAAYGSFVSLNFPPGFVITNLVFILPMIGLAAFICTQHTVYAKHWRAINAAYTFVLMFTTTSVQRLCLWQRAHVGGRSSTVHAFALENFFLTVINSRNIAFSAGQAPDLFLTTVSLLLAIAGNQSLCGSELWGPERVTLSPVISSIPRKASAFLSAFWGYQFSMVPHNAPLSCPALLAFWQVLAWFIACLVIVLREILSRRAFLKAYGSVYGRAVAAGAQAWPLGSVVMLHKLLFAVLFFLFTANVMWAIAVITFQ